MMVARFTRLALAVLIGLAAAPAAQAQDKPTLTVYTYDSFSAEWGPGPALKTGFEAQCGCTLDYVAADDAIAMLRKVQLEGPTTKADLVVGLDTAIAGEARATGLFADQATDLSALDLPMAWTDKQFVPFDWGYFAFVYDKTKVPNPPKSFEDLIALPASFKIVVEDPRSSTPGLGLLLWIEAAYGDRAPEIWAGLKPHILTMTRGWSEAYGLFLKGEADMALSYTTSPAYHAVAEGNDNYAWAEFSEGHFPQVETAGILKSSPHPELAQQFLTYLVSPQGQAAIPTTNWMYPVVQPAEPLPAAFDAQPRPQKTLGIDEGAIAANLHNWIDQALAALQ